MPLRILMTSCSHWFFCLPAVLVVPLVVSGIFPGGVSWTLGSWDFPVSFGLVSFTSSSTGFGFACATSDGTPATPGSAHAGILGSSARTMVLPLSWHFI